MTMAEETIVQPARQTWRRPLTIAIVMLAVVMGTIIGWRYWHYAHAHESTDNATLTGNIVQIAPQVAGTVRAVHVVDNQMVQAGDLLVELDNATYQTAVKQARANLDAAIAQADGAGISVALTDDTGNAQILQAQAAVSQTDHAIESTQSDVTRAHAAVQQARDTSLSVQSTIATAEAARAAAQAQKKRAEAGVLAAAAQVATARANINAAQAALDAAKAVTDKAERDNKRYQKLLAEGAIGAQMAEQATVAAQTAFAQQQAALEQVNSSKAALAAREADVTAAKEQVTATDAAITQAQTQILTTRQQYQSSVSGVAQVQAQLQMSQKSVQQAQARRAQAMGQLIQAHTTPTQVNLSRSSVRGAQARIAQAQAALEAAQLQLSYTRILAPVTGFVSKKNVQQGILVQSGMPLMALVPPPPANIWIVANFKETQLAQMRCGQRALVKIDSFPGITLTGHVDSMASATGATFALLPPDNASGNFTKVVQRIPVKLVFDSGQAAVAQLRAGMSATVTVTTEAQ